MIDFQVWQYEIIYQFEKYHAECAEQAEKILLITKTLRPQ